MLLPWLGHRGHIRRFGPFRRHTYPDRLQRLELPLLTVWGTWVDLWALM